MAGFLAPGAGKALIADADDGARDAVFRILTQVGFSEIDEVSDGSDALRALDRSRYDLIISDTALPNMNGFEFVEVLRNPTQIRFDHHKARTPVIFLSESKREEHIARARELGGKGYLLKPLSPEALKARLMKLYGL